MTTRQLNVACLGLFVSLLISAPAHAAENFQLQVRQFVDDTRFNGVALVGKGALVDYVEAFGLADAETLRPIKRNSRFFTGSVGKWLASIMVLRLVDDGKLKLDEPILTYLPEYREDTGKQLTLRHLLSNGSGLPDSLMDAYEKDPSIQSDRSPVPDAVARFASGDLKFAPGTRFDYNLTNWLLVQAILERVTRESFEQLAKRLVFKPLRMADSGISAGESQDIRELAQGYRALKPKAERNVFAIPAYIVAAGGFYSTADDMLRLTHGVLSGKLLSTESRKALLTIEHPESAYALGGRVRTFASKKRPSPYTVATNDGTGGAYRTVAWRVMEDGRTVIFMSNLRPDDAKLFDLTESLLEFKQAPAETAP